MVTACFRFYEELNDFLPPQRRTAVVQYTYDDNTKARQFVKISQADCDAGRGTVTYSDAVDPPHLRKRILLLERGYAQDGMASFV